MQSNLYLVQDTIVEVNKIKESIPVPVQIKKIYNAKHVILTLFGRRGVVQVQIHGPNPVVCCIT